MLTLHPLPFRPILAGAPIASRMRQNLGAALVGNLLEWYDFAVYGFMRRHR